MGAATQHSLLGGLFEAAVFVLVGHGLSDKQSRTTAKVIIKKLSFVWANNTIHIPKGQRYKDLLRYQQIFNDFTGNNHAALGLKYKLSIQRIYTIVKQMRRRHELHHQMDFFGHEKLTNREDNNFVTSGLLVLEDIMCYSSICISEMHGMDKKTSDRLGMEIANHSSNHLHGQFAYIRSTPADIHDARQREMLTDD